MTNKDTTAMLTAMLEDPDCDFNVWVAICEENGVDPWEFLDRYASRQDRAGRIVAYASVVSVMGIVGAGIVFTLRHSPRVLKAVAGPSNIGRALRLS